MKKIAIIPARGGSKRIERKNVREFCGVPVIAYSIRAALGSGCFDEVMVSTDDEEIAAVARRYGASVPFMRSAKSSDDYATTADVINEVLESYRVRGEEFDILACIYATAPFITASRLEDAVAIVESGRAQAAFTCVEYSYPIQRSLRIDPESGRIGMRYPEYASARSQDLEKTYHDAGQFYVSSVKSFRECGSLWGPDTLPVVLPETEVQDLDTLTDWKIAEMKYSLLAFPGRFMAEGYEFIPYTEMDEEISLRMLEGRNAPDVRERMVNTGEISREDHERFIDSLSTRRDKQYYAVKDPSGELIGSVNMEWRAPGVMERGIWLDASSRGKGHSRRLLDALYDYFRIHREVEKITTLVRHDNEASLALERSLGSVETGRDADYVYFEKKL